MSLSRAFRYAGARSVLASLWLVKDNDAADIMDRFYHALLHGSTKSAALQYARLEMSDSQHPFFWAGYVLSGDDGVVKGMGNRPWIYWIFLGAAGLFTLWILIHRIRQRKFK